MSIQNVIALICDCDGTLSPDTTELLIEKLDGNPADFWKNVSGLVRDGWDPPVAYMTGLMTLAQSKPIGNISLDLLKVLGKGITFFPGVVELIDHLQKRIDDNEDFHSARIKIELSIISGGIEETIKNSAIGEKAKDIYGCSYFFDDKGIARGIKRTVTFTEKTKYVFAINKGIIGDELRKKPYLVNDVMEDEDRRVPFEHMIYIGDGPSDIPCFSMIKYLGGAVIGVVPPEDKELTKPYELAVANRLTMGPYTANYNEHSELYKWLARYVDGIATKILVKRAQKIKAAPSH